MMERSIADLSLKNAVETGLAIYDRVQDTGHVGKHKFDVIYPISENLKDKIRNILDKSAANNPRATNVLAKIKGTLVPVEKMVVIGANLTVFAAAGGVFVATLPLRPVGKGLRYLGVSISDCPAKHSKLCKTGKALLKINNKAAALTAASLGAAVGHVVRITNKGLKKIGIQCDPSTPRTKALKEKVSKSVSSQTLQITADLSKSMSVPDLKWCLGRQSNLEAVEEDSDLAIQLVTGGEIEDEKQVHNFLFGISEEDINNLVQLIDLETAGST